MSPSCKSKVESSYQDAESDRNIPIVYTCKFGHRNTKFKSAYLFDIVVYNFDQPIYLKIFDSIGK